VNQTRTKLHFQNEFTLRLDRTEPINGKIILLFYISPFNLEQVPSSISIIYYVFIDVLKISTTLSILCLRYDVDKLRTRYPIMIVFPAK